MENNEAPLSMNFRVSYKGVNVQFTNRDPEASLKPHMEKAKIAIDWALSNGFETEVQRSFGNKPKIEKEYIEGRVCPLDGGKLVKPQPGSKAPIKCENNKWNPTTKEAYGCKHIEWPNKQQSDDIPERQVE